MKSTSHHSYAAPRSSAHLSRPVDLLSWFAKATSLLLLTIAMLALVALTGCKDASKTGTGGAGAGSGSPPLSAPPSAPPSPPAAETPAAGGTTATPPSGASSAPGGSGMKP